MSSKTVKWAVGASVIALLPVAQAHAAGTLAGSTVTNTFDLSYQVNNSGTTVTETDVDSASFTVDRVVDVLVTAPTPVVEAGAVNSTVTHDFTITNEGNDTQTMLLSLANVGGDDLDVDAGAVTYQISYDGGATFQAYTIGDPTDPLAPDASAILRVVSTVPIGATGEQATYSLTAQVAEADGTPVTLSTGANTDGVETVFIDDAGSDDAGTDAQSSARATVEVVSGDLQGEKNVELMDPAPTDDAACGSDTTAATANGNYFIPGACVRYTITVRNPSAVDITDIALTDTLETTLRFVRAEISANLDTLDAPTAPVDCTAATTCEVTTTGGQLAAADTSTGGAGVQTGTLQIWAIVR